MKEIVVKEKIPIYEEKEKTYFQSIDGQLFNTADEAIKRDECYKNNQKELAKFQLNFAPPLHIIEKIDSGEEYRNIEKEIKSGKGVPWMKIWQLSLYNDIFFSCLVSGMNKKEAKEFIRKNNKK